MRSKELWLLEENHATVKPDLSVVPRGMKTYSESRIELRNLKILKKMLEKSSQVLSSEQPCDPKSLDVAFTIAGVEKIPSVVAVILEAICLNERSITWLKANKLSINVKKTKLMIFGPRQKTLPVTMQIVLENNVLEQVDNTKFLGVYIDQHLDWKTHVNFIAAKISKSVGLLYKAKYYLPSKSLLTLYYALIYPHLTFFIFFFFIYTLF